MLFLFTDKAACEECYRKEKKLRKVFYFRSRRRETFERLVNTLITKLIPQIGKDTEYDIK